MQKSIDQTLADLGVDSVDLFLVHWPVRLVPNEGSELFPMNPDGSRAVDKDWDQAKTWAAMEEVLAQGEFGFQLGLATRTDFFTFLQARRKLSESPTGPSLTWRSCRRLGRLFPRSTRSVRRFYSSWKRADRPSNRSSYTLSTLSTSSRRGVTSVEFFSRPTALSAQPVSDFGQVLTLAFTR